ncbi:hypothetical protein ScPMuIL_009084 [Solemya velum]
MASPTRKQSAPEKKEMNPVIISYLTAYNVAQMLGWTAIMLGMVNHLLNMQTNVKLYSDVAPLLNIFQTAAFLEIIHSVFGLVKSSVFMTTFQVFSRILLTWGVVYSVESVQDSIGVTLFLFAWTITEIIRYSFYFFTLLGQVPDILIWCRYTFFIVLYPIGVTGELLTIAGSLSYVKETKLYSFPLPNVANISFNYYYYLLAVMFSYIPLFPQLYFHMVGQRKKVLGGKKLKTG